MGHYIRLLSLVGRILETIGTRRSCFKQVISKDRFNIEELITLSIEVEAAINSRLLTYIDDDPNNNMLTPNHLIRGRNIHEKCYNYKFKDSTGKDARFNFDCTAKIM